MMGVIARNIQTLRLKRRYTQDEVAVCLHIGRTTYAGYEHGERPVPIEELAALADLYQVSLDTIVRMDIGDGAAIPAKMDEAGMQARTIFHVFPKLGEDERAEIIRLINEKARKAKAARAE